jgi:hypothetical protein
MNDDKEYIDRAKKALGVTEEEARAIHDSVRFDSYMLSFIHQMILTTVIAGASWFFDNEPISVATAAAISLAVCSYGTAEGASAIGYAHGGRSVAYAVLSILVTIGLVSLPFILSCLIALSVSVVYP